MLRPPKGCLHKDCHCQKRKIYQCNDTEGDKCLDS